MKYKSAAIVSVSSIVICLTIAGLQAQQTPAAKPPVQGNPLAGFEHPKNLKVLPKKISAEELQNTMRIYSMSLGVRCGFCHEVKVNKVTGKPEADFASDAKPEKTASRQMIRMTADINKKYLGKMSPDFEQIACVTCHRGSAKPMVSVDSLPKKMEMMPKKQD